MASWEYTQEADDQGNPHGNRGDQESIRTNSAYRSSVDQIHQPQGGTRDWSLLRLQLLPASVPLRLLQDRRTTHKQPGKGEV